jgi:hypothetical protein
MDTSATDKSITCAIGEHLVLGELLKRDYSAYLAHGPTQKGWDILIVYPNQELVKVQVKTIGWPEKNKCNVTISESFIFDYMVVVLLDKKNERSRFLVASRNEVKNMVSKNTGERKAKSRTWAIPGALNPENVNHKAVLALEDKWQKLTANKAAQPRRAKKRSAC